MVGVRAGRWALWGRVIGIDGECEGLSKSECRSFERTYWKKRNRYRRAVRVKTTRVKVRAAALTRRRAREG